MKHLYLLQILFFVLSFCQIAQAQNKLSIEQIMEGNKFIGYSPENIYWSEDSKKIYFNWNPTLEKTSSLHFIQVQNGKALGTPQKVSEAESAEMPARFGTYNKSKTQKIYVKNGDIFLYQNGKSRQITNTVETENNVSFSMDEQSIIFQRGDNLFSLKLNDGTLRQLTDFKQGTEEKPKDTPKEDKYLQNQQIELIEVLRERKKQNEINKKTNESRQPKRPKAIYLQGKRLTNLQISPNQDFISFVLVKSPADKNTKVPNYVAESGYVEDINARQKVGTPQNTYQAAIYHISKDTVMYLDFKQLEGIYDLPDYYKEYKRNPEKKEAREVTPFRWNWSEDGKNTVLTLRSQDNKDFWIVKIEPSTAKLQGIFRERDEAWVNLKGIAGFIDNQTYFFTSEKSGYNHLYSVNLQTNQIKQLTDGKFEISEAYLSKDKTKWYLRSNEVHLGEYHFYKMPLNGGKRSKITNQTGMYEITPSPDEKYLALRYSYSNKPWELYVKENKMGATETQITQSLTENFKKHTWIDPQIVTFRARDNAEVYARIYRPANPEKQGKAVIFVHGAGYLQNVHKGWSSYFREYMFHNFLVQNGYTVLDIDYRASEGYGRDWRTGIYRYMGDKDLTDHIDGAKFLVEKYDISPDKIGIYGGSYGGFITLMALFTSPDTFKAGAALRSVTDWAHYNHGYTANILNTPVLDSIAFLRSSPIYFAEGLKNRLLICHGVVDDNVQFQDVVRLAQRLIELKKENWEFALYPVEPHGFVEPTSWMDEYKRIFKLFEESLR